MRTTITPVGDPKLLRTLKYRTPKLVWDHTQPPVGMVICPHCHEETKIFAAGLFNIIGEPHPMQEVLKTSLPVTVPQQKIVCHHCGGKAWVAKLPDVLRLEPIDPGPEVREAEAILDRKQLAAQQTQGSEGPDFI